MQLPVIDGYIYPTALPVVEGGEYIEATSDQHGVILDNFSSEEDAIVYKPDGSSEKLTAKIRENLTKSLEKHPGMSEVNKRVRSASRERDKKRKDAMASIGKKREKEDA